jgi:beta-galactosidase
LIGKKVQGQAHTLSERLHILDDYLTFPVAQYGKANGWLDDQVAITIHSVGRGFVYYIGTCLDDAARRQIVEHICKNASIPSIQTPPGLELCTRMTDDGSEIYILINHDRLPQALTLPWPARDQITGHLIKGETLFQPYEVVVLTQEKIDET